MSEEYFKEVYRDLRRRADWRLKDGMQANGDFYKDGVKIDHLRGPGGPIIDRNRFDLRSSGISFREQDNKEITV
jgi:hypothetical protein